MPSPQLLWDIGTAYDFFLSLNILHNPTRYGLRAAWAAGMRSRLPPTDREFLEDMANLFPLEEAFHWIHTLPAPKDGSTVLQSLEQIPSPERLPALMLKPWQQSSPTAQILLSVARKGSWDKTDLEPLWSVYREEYDNPTLNRDEVNKVLDWWVHPGEFGERLLHALRNYHEAFFAEEERRIHPALELGLSQAQTMAQEHEIVVLLERLSQGVRLAIPLDVSEIVLVPSYWSSPLIFFTRIAPGRMILAFGVRPLEDSLVPGETVPDAMLKALKALSDPTRLRILRYLFSEPLTPTQLAQRLRLRAPTVVHHLNILRTAGLVYVTVGEGREKDYQSRPEGIYATCDALQRFLLSQKE